MRIEGDIGVFTEHKVISHSEKSTAEQNESDVQAAASQTGVIYEKSDATELEYHTYNADGMIKGTNAARSLSSNQSIQSALKTLGFYYGPYDGYLTSDASKKAIRNFQMVYGLDCTGTMNQATLSKLDLVDGFRNRAANILKENSNNTLVKGLDYYEKENYANIWAFLRLGMGLGAMHASAVMANIKAESGFSSDNLRDTETNKNHHDTDYVYKAEDGKAYGILQWAAKIRKTGLKNQADSMGLAYSNLNAQLAYFRREMNTASLYKTQWSVFKSKNTLNEATDYFLDEIEDPEVNNFDERRNYADQIYQLMYKL